MKAAVFLVAFIATCHISTTVESKSLAKRQLCSEGRCYSSPCGTARECNSCTSGDCSRSTTSTCPSCVNKCSRTCSTGGCVNSCLDSCSCDSRITETETPSDRCCDVLHPKRCFTEENGNKRCVIRKHRECSDLCSSSVVSIQERKGASSGCHYIRNYPYVYCGNYERTNCGQCRSCDGTFENCSRRSECNDVGCRSISSTVSPREQLSYEQYRQFNPVTQDQESE